MRRHTFRSFLSTALAFNIGAQTLQMIFVPLLTHYFDVNEYGSWVLLIATAGAIGIFSSLRLDQALQLSNTKTELDQIAFTGMVSCLAIPWILFLISWAIAPHNLAFTFQCATLASLIGLNAIQIAKSNKDKHYKRVIIGQTFISLGFPIFSIFFSNFVASVNPFFLSSLICYLCSIVLNSEYKSFLVKNHPSVYFMQARLMRSTLINSTKYLKYSLPATILSLIKEQIPLYTLLILAGNSAVAIFSLGMRVINIPSNLFASILRPKFASQLTESLGNEISKKYLTREIREIINFLRILLSCLVAGLYGFTDYVVENAFSESWQNIDATIMILGVLMVPQVLIGWLDRTLDLMGKQALLLKYELISILVLITVYCVSFFIKINQDAYILIYCITGLLLYLWLMIVTLELNGIDKKFIAQTFLKLSSQIFLQMLVIFLMKISGYEFVALVLFAIGNMIILRQSAKKLPDWFW